MKINSRKVNWVFVLIHFFIISFLIHIFDFFFSSVPDVADYINHSQFFQSEIGNGLLWGYFETIPMVVTIVTVLLYSYFILHRRPSMLGFRKKQWLKNGAMGIGIGAILFTISVFLLVISGNIVITGISSSADILSLIVYFLGFLIQGMEEEILYRCYLFQSLKEKSSIWFATLISAVVFSLAHYNNIGFGIMPFLNLFLWGIFAAMLYERFHNIWIISTFHGTWNYVQGNIWGIFVSGNEFDCMLFDCKLKGTKLFTGGAFGLEGSIAVTVVMVCAVVFLCYKNHLTERGRNKRTV